MKKNLFFLLLLAIIAMSCQKDIEQGSVAAVAEQPKTDYFNSVTPKPSPNDDIAQRIDAFKALIEPTSNFGSGNEMSVDAAIWGIEAVLNQRFSNASKPFIAQQIDSANFTVSLNVSGEINSNDVALALVSAKQALKEQWNKVRESAKHVIVADIALRSQSASTVTFAIISSIGIEQIIRGVLPPAIPFGGGEGWKDGELAGGCVLNSGRPGDAATKIMDKWTHRWIGEINQYYYTDITTIPVNRDGQGASASQFFYANKWIFSTNTSFSPVCISDIPYADIGTLNGYLAGIPLLIDALQPQGKTYITMGLTSHIEHNPSNDGRCHKANILYGIAHFQVQVGGCCD